MMPGTAMPGMAVPAPHSWAPLDVALLFLMWAVMMVAMMLPSAAPQYYSRFISLWQGCDPELQPVSP